MIWTILSIAWKPIAALLAILGIYAAGSRNARQNAKIDDLKDYKKTREAIDNADITGDDPDLAKRWLRERGKSERDL